MGSWDRDIQMFDTESQTRLKTHVEVINYDKVWRYDRFNSYFDFSHIYHTSLNSVSDNIQKFSYIFVMMVIDSFIFDKI